jgi:hypothetical protein
LKDFGFFFRGFFEDYIFAWQNICVSVILLLPLDSFKCKWQGQSVRHPLLFWHKLVVMGLVS